MWVKEELSEQFDLVLILESGKNPQQIHFNSNQRH